MLVFNYLFFSFIQPHCILLSGLTYPLTRQAQHLGPTVLLRASAHLLIYFKNWREKNDILGQRKCLNI